MRHRSIRALILLAASALAFAQTAPPADQNSAGVEGMVVNAVTGDPVPRAHVMLFSFADGKQQTYGAMTTAEGKFSITGLPGGNYSPSADRLGFLFDRPSNGFTLKPGDRNKDVTLKLTPTGAIAGTVVDADGEPVENCSVMAESSRGSQGLSSDAQGRFRIGGLAPGKYKIKAMPEEPQTLPEIRTDGTAETHYVETYYPNAPDAAGGATINVAPGSETGGFEIRLVRTPIVRVSGKVTGLPQGAENVMVVPLRPPGNRQRLFGGSTQFFASIYGASQVKKDGTFTLWRLAPGPYRIRAQWNSPAAQAVASAPVEIVVGDADIDGLELRMMAAADVTGQVEYENDDARPPLPAETAQPVHHRGPQLLLQGVDGTDANANAQVDASGVFTFEKVVPGRYRVMWVGGKGYVKSIRLGATEMTDGVLDLSGGAAGATVSVLISAQFGSISGTVQADGAPTEGLHVMLLRDGPEPGAGMPFQFGSIGAGGNYSLDSVVPGTYKLAAIAEDDISAVLQGGDKWDAYAPVTEAVTVRAGEKAAQDLKVLPKQ